MTGGLISSQIHTITLIAKLHTDLDAYLSQTPDVTCLDECLDVALR